MADHALLQALLDLSYDDDVRFRYNGQYLGYDGFGLTPAPMRWNLEKGNYNALVGYWIWIDTGADDDVCWQAQNTNGPLVFWNSDGIAQYPPQDWELFVFEIVDWNQGTAKVKNIYGRYVNFNGNAFVCEADSAGAAVFLLEFAPTLPLIPPGPQ
jgi:hypothetical protein